MSEDMPRVDKQIGRYWPPRQQQADLQLAEEILEGSVVHRNIYEDYLVVTADKIRLCLHDYQSVLKAQTDWITPFGVLVALGTTLVAAEFNTFLGIGPEVWKSLYIVGSVTSSVWLIYAVYRAVRVRGKGDVEYIVGTLMRGSTVGSSEQRNSRS